MKIKSILKKSVMLSFIIALLMPITTYADINISRISGQDRYETALKVNQKYFVNERNDTVVISTGEDFRLSLHASYLANSLKVPYYIIPNLGLSSKIMNEFRVKGVKTAYIVGGHDKLNKSIDNSLKSIGIKVHRLDDKDVTKGSLDEDIDEIIFNKFHKNDMRGDIGNGIVVSDEKFPDILASIPFVSALAREEETYLLCNYRLLNVGDDDGELNGFRYIIGGYETIPSYIKAHLPENGENPFSRGRISGTDRYETAIEVAKYYEKQLEREIRTVVLVDGTNYPDALSSGTVASMDGGVILLTEPNTLNSKTKQFIKNNNIKNVIIVGGEKSVSKNVENELKELK